MSSSSELFGLFYPSIFSLIIAAIVAAIFYSQGFFRLPLEAVAHELAKRVRFWHTLSGFILYAFFQFILPWIIFSLFPESHASIYGIGLTFLFVIALSAVSLFFLWYTFPPPTREEIIGPVKSFWNDVGLGALTYLLAHPLANLVSQLVYIWITLTEGSYAPQAQVAIAHLKATSSYPIIHVFTLLCFAFVVPMIEEFLFRGLLQKWLASRIESRAIVIFTTALLFSLIHYSKTQGLTNYELIPSIFVLGIFLSYVREKRSLFASMGLHSTFNTLSLIYITFA